MKNKKGFTLIELLAVIVVLAIVAVVTMTIIVPILSDKPAEAAVINLKEINATAEKACAAYDMNLSDYGELQEFTTDCVNSSCSVNPENPTEFIRNLKIVGDAPDKITMTISKCIVQASCIHYSTGKFKDLTIKLINNEIVAKNTANDWKC